MTGQYKQYGFGSVAKTWVQGDGAQVFAGNGEKLVRLFGGHLLTGLVPAVELLICLYRPADAFR